MNGEVGCLVILFSTSFYITAPVLLGYEQHHKLIRHPHHPIHSLHVSRYTLTLSSISCDGKDAAMP